MEIGVLTYTGAHRKTYDTLCLLKARGYTQVSVYAVPHHYKKTFFPLYEHRPRTFEGIPLTSQVCHNFGYSYIETISYQMLMENLTAEVFRKIGEGGGVLVCGAGLLPEKLIDDYRVINSHPGYLPNCRGLDALKWAIYEGQPIGVTSHFVGSEIDAGEIIERKIVPVNYNDTFHAVAMRIYEYEIQMLVDAIEKINDKHEYITSNGYPLHKRMPHHLEMRLMDKFETLRMNVPD